MRSILYLFGSYGWTVVSSESSSNKQLKLWGYAYTMISCMGILILCCGGGQKVGLRLVLSNNLSQCIRHYHFTASKVWLGFLVLIILGVRGSESSDEESVTRLENQPPLQVK